MMKTAALCNRDAETHLSPESTAWVLWYISEKTLQPHKMYKGPDRHLCCTELLKLYTHVKQ